jgi:Vacuolar protein 14 C-terminal Fig4p binding
VPVDASHTAFVHLTRPSRVVQAYDHASLIVASFADVSITVDLLVQMDQLVQLLETPVFTYLRLQLLEPGQYTALMKTLHGVLLLQSSAWVTLSSRLQCVPTLYQLQSAPAPAGRDSADLLARFKAVTLKAHQ